MNDPGASQDIGPTPGAIGGPAPSIGRIVVYRSRTGSYDVPAVINCTEESLNPKGVAAHEKDPTTGVPPLSGPRCVHLTVFSPGIPGQRAEADDFEAKPRAGLIGENIGGSYQEWDIDQWAPELPASDSPESEQPAGTWRWPTVR